MSWNARRAYWIWKITRERGLLLLVAILAAIFIVLYYFQSTGFWEAAKNPPEFVSGILVKIWQPSAFEDPTYLTFLKVQMDDGNHVQMRGTSKLIPDCSVGDKVEILKYTNEDNKSYFRIGPRACLANTSKTSLL